MRLETVAADDAIVQFARQDALAQLLGIELLEAGPGFARATMTVGLSHLNSHGILHGGATFTLADFCFAVACNSHGQAAFALHVDINFLASAPLGARLLAEATEEHLGNRIGLYHVRVMTEEGMLIAACHGMAYRKREHLA